MAYAALPDVRSRAGVLGRAWTPTSQPSTSEIEAFLTNVADEIDSVLGARGITVPTTGPSARALLGLNAAGALVLALEATYEGDRDDGVDKTIDRWRTRYDKAMESLVTGKHPAVALLESTPSSPSASSLWTDEPEYGTVFPPERDSDLNPALSPPIYRGRSF